MKAIELIATVGVSFLIIGLVIAQATGFSSDALAVVLMFSSLIIAIMAALSRMAD